MKKTLETAGFLLAVIGAAGIVQHYVGWFRLWAVLRHLPLSDGHLLGANIGLVVVGAVLMVLSDTVHDRHRRRTDLHKQHSQIGRHHPSA